MLTNVILEAIHHRRSCRFFDKEHIVEKDKLYTIMEAGLWAPNGMGHQDPIIVSVQDKDLLDELRSLNAQVRGTNADPYYGSQAFIFVFGNKDWKHHVEDCSLVIGTMMLAAESLGLGTCWIDESTHVFELSQSKILKEKFGLPNNYESVGSLAIGYATKETKPRARKDGRIKQF